MPFGTFKFVLARAIYVHFNGDLSLRRVPAKTPDAISRGHWEISRTAFRKALVLIRRTNRHPEAVGQPVGPEVANKDTPACQLADHFTSLFRSVELAENVIALGRPRFDTVDLFERIEHRFTVVHYGLDVAQQVVAVFQRRQCGCLSRYVYVVR